MDDAVFIRYLTEWHEFFLTAAQAGATLLGLLFVGISLNVDEIMAPERPELRVLAEQAFASFIYVLLIGLFFLIPRQDPLSIGIELGTLGVLGLARVVVRAIRVPRALRAAARRTWGTAWVVRRLGLPAIAYAGLLLSAWGIGERRIEAMSFVVTVLLVLLTSAADSSWDLLVKVSADKRRRTAEAAVASLRASPPVAPALEVPAAAAVPVASAAVPSVPAALPGAAAIPADRGEPESDPTGSS